MTNLKKSYKLILKELRQISDRKNFHFQPIKPKLSDIELIILVILAEFKSIVSEYQLFRKIKGWEIDGEIEQPIFLLSRTTSILSILIRIELQEESIKNYKIDFNCSMFFLLFPIKI